MIALLYIAIACIFLVVYRSGGAGFWHSFGVAIVWPLALAVRIVIWVVE